MKLGVFQDIHGNLPALKKGIETFREQGCDKIVHVGDLVGIGPFPKESLEFAFTIEELDFVMGNHDYWYAYGLPNPIPDWMTEEEVQHRSWVINEIGGDYCERVKKWPFALNYSIGGGRTLTFQHYGLTSAQNWFASRIENPTVAQLDQLFRGIDSEMIFYGHAHSEDDQTGRCRYVNLGSAGCFNKPEVRIGILEIEEESLELKKFSVPYSDGELMAAFEAKRVPVRERITHSFICRD